MVARQHSGHKYEKERYVGSNVRPQSRGERNHRLQKVCCCYYKNVHTKFCSFPHHPFILLFFFFANWKYMTGCCMDTIYSGPSSIPNAGRGAFANRKFTKCHIDDAYGPSDGRRYCDDDPEHRCVRQRDEAAIT